METLGAILPFILILGVFWLLFLRPQQRRQRELLQLQSSLKAGDEVMLTSGIFGTISETADDHVLVELSPGVTVKVVTGAIARVLTEPEPVSDDAAGPEEN
ncbi:preprotein translocase subunit YajC [Nocardioides sp.]|uniref:preprotein translocase subunit YajC n=1 Tax=Nocardioides sp. TaxID=35761 RepID=UPI0039E37A5B